MTLNNEISMLNNEKVKRKNSISRAGFSMEDYTKYDAR